MKFDQTVASVAKAPGTPSANTLRLYCNLGLLPHIRDANGRRLLRADAAEIARRVYAGRLERRGRPSGRNEAGQKAG